MTENNLARLSGSIDQVYVINLASRPDRRREIMVELKRVGLDENSALLHVFPAVQPDSAGSFPSIGARGCFLSHLGVLRHAHDNGYRAILILEDDADFTTEYVTHWGAVLDELGQADWSMAYLGHRIAAEQMPVSEDAQGAHWRSLPPDVAVQCTHAVLFHRRGIEKVIGYLERMIEREPGHADGGPMHVDGAYNWFRRDHPDLSAFVTPYEYVIQRASKSDIMPASWKEHLPLVRLMRRLKNAFSRRK